MSNGTGQVYLAVDLGASSGRVLAGSFDGSRITLEEVHRFDNGGVYVGERLYWNLLGLWEQVKGGLRRAREQFGPRVASVGVDTWGVDFGLLGRDDELLSPPRHYRDRRTAGILDRAFERVSREEIFASSGLQFMEFNTLYQLLAMREQNSSVLEAAQSFMMIPDLFHWLMTGEKANEFSNATTTQFFNPATGEWAKSLLERFDLPTNILQPIVPPGTKLGKLQRQVAEETGLSDVQVVLPGTHDTASAVMAVPTASPPSAQPDWCYISSGTWSLMGVETPGPVINDQCRQYNFTNEGGVGGTIRLLKNIGGLWLVQQSRRSWSMAGRDYGWTELVRMAEKAPPLRSLIDPDHADFVAPVDMPTAIREYCSRTGQPAPNSEGAIVRTALESLALRYRMVLGWLEQLTGGRIETIHIVGGGSINQLLNQMTADACNRRVVAGPVEATAIGNVMMQVVASGGIGSIAEAREVIRRSFDVTEFTPQNPTPWDEAFGRFGRLVG
ncbi:MAG: rhamnulokinase family protein [Pirellulaceae bacterium]|nr:rhamnulokinase [Planctomycetales bacterium]